MNSVNGAQIVLNTGDRAGAILIKGGTVPNFTMITADPLPSSLPVTVSNNQRVQQLAILTVSSNNPQSMQVLPLRSSEQSSQALTTKTSTGFADGVRTKIKLDPIYTAATNVTLQAPGSRIVFAPAASTNSQESEAQSDFIPLKEGKYESCTSSDTGDVIVDTADDDCNLVNASL